MPTRTPTLARIFDGVGGVEFKVSSLRFKVKMHGQTFKPEI
jgi:hypothetical protein